MDIKTNDPAVFWAEYAKLHNEEIFAHALGRYLGGWNVEGKPLAGPLWGLLIATSGGFRFHHFPQEGWIVALSRISGGGAEPQEKTIFVPKEAIVQTEIFQERSWWKKILFSMPPSLSISYRLPDGTTGLLRADSDYQISAVAEALRIITV